MLLTRKEATEYLGLAPTRLKDLARDLRGPRYFVCPKGRAYYRQEDLDHYREHGDYVAGEAEASPIMGEWAALLSTVAKTETDRFQG